MKKEKKKWEMPLRRKLLIVILVIAMVILVVAGIFSCASNVAEESNKLTLSDWLVATCSVVGLAGTLILSCITITQTAKANETNDKLFKQNQDLQKITELQSRLTNQESYPLILAENIDFSFCDIDVEKEDTCWGLKEKKEECCFSDFYNQVSYRLDGRFKADKEFGKCTSIAFDFFNRSKAKISKIKINKIESTYPLSFEKTVTVEHSTIFQENDSVKCVFLIYHENDLGEIGDSIKMLNIKFYIEVTLVTGVTFEEELRLTNAQFSKAYSRVESLELLQK